MQDEALSFLNMYLMKHPELLAEEQGGPIARTFKLKIGPRTIPTPIDDVPVGGDYSLPSIERQTQNINRLRELRGLSPMTPGQYMSGV